jgi:hypothetical protein
MRVRMCEVNFRRVYEAIERRIYDVPNNFIWNLNISFAAMNKTRLLLYKNKHLNGRCFIIGNGPSLKRMDLCLLKDEITFGMNRIYLLFDQLGFQTTYFVCINELVLDQFAHDIVKLTMPKFLNWRRRHLFANNEDTLFVRTKYSLLDTFEKEPTMNLSSGGTVTYAAMQLCHYMGFREVILIGVDHNFVDKGIPNKTEVRTSETDENHFHPNYFHKGIKWQLPDLWRSEEAYRMAKKVFESDGRKIYDATEGGKLTVFPKVDYYSLFK